MKNTWRDYFRPTIAKLLKQHGHLPDSQLKKVMRENFPSGVQGNWPYTVWLSEIRNQRGIKKKKPQKVMDAEKQQLKLF